MNGTEHDFRSTVLERLGILVALGVERRKALILFASYSPS